MSLVEPDEARLAKADAEEKFKYAVRKLIAENRYPSPKQIRLFQGDMHFAWHWPTRPLSRELNGRECRWRDEVLLTLPDDHWAVLKHRQNGGSSLAWKRVHRAKRA